MASWLTWIRRLLGPAPWPPMPPPPQPLDPPAPPPPAEPGAGGGGRVIRVTDERDGELLNRGYSYWSQTWVGPSGFYVFAGHKDGRPRFFIVDQSNGEVSRLGPRIPHTGTSEGWYWDAEGWIYLCDGPRLHRVNPFTGEDRICFDISERFPGCDIFQVHSSDDGLTHSATVRRVVSDGRYPSIGTVVSRAGGLDYFPARGVLDESQITPDGQFLVIKEDDDNRIITLATGEERRIADADGAVGHSDCGPGFLVGEDNYRGACVLIDLQQQPLTPGRVLFSTWNMGYVSVRAGRCLHSGDTHLSLVALDGSGVTPLVEHGGGSAYDDRVKANLSPCGSVATYMSRGVVYLLVLPMR